MKELQTFTNADLSPTNILSETDDINSKDVVIPNFVGDVSSDLMKTFSMGDILCPDIEDEIDYVPSPESVKKKMSFKKTRSSRGVRKVLKYPV